MRHANAAVLTSSSVQVSKSSIQIPVNASAPNPGHSAEMPRISTTLHVNVHVPIDQKAAPTLRPLIMTLVGVAVLTSLDAQVDRGSTQTLANVSALNQSQHVHQAKSSIPTRVNASVQIDQQAVPMLGFSTMNFAGASVPGDLDVPVDISSMKINAHVNVLTLD